MAVKRLHTGEELGYEALDMTLVWYATAEVMRVLARGIASLAALLPLPMAFGNSTIVTMRHKTSTTHYTAENLLDLLLLDKDAKGVASTYELYLEEGGNMTDIRFPPMKVG